MATLALAFALLLRGLIYIIVTRIYFKDPHHTEVDYPGYISAMYLLADLIPISF